MAAPAEAASKTYELGYFLPKTRAGAKVAQRLVRCPGSSREPKFETTVVIASKTVADPTLIRVDARKGMLAKRTTELKLRADGTLESFNATNEGQGGVVISALVKAGATLASGGVVGAMESHPSSLPFDCTQEAKEALKEQERLRENILELESAIATPDAPVAAISTELAARRAEFQRISDLLTVTSSGPPIDPAKGTLGGFAHIPRPDIASFFDLSTPAAKAAFESYRVRQVGQQGFGISWQADKPMATALQTSMTFPTKAVPGLVYRRAVPAAISVFPCSGPPSVTAVCAKDESSTLARTLSANGSASFPQLSGLFTIPIGRGGLFGSEEVAAEFDASGAPTRLKYGSDPGAAAIAGVVDTARTTYASLEKASAAEQQAQLEELKRRKEIRELEYELSKPVAE
ncbi:hypothetical protein [Sphingomonas sediminicola]|uniref:hypothetical protein n=1 Tax=Sphingomonas sediminicola TaxID=386874 RepID=UPI001CA70AD1|nr:hypothetical protein [Sphingomonas sediminicola]